MPNSRFSQRLQKSSREQSSKEADVILSPKKRQQVPAQKILKDADPKRLRRQ